MDSDAELAPQSQIRSRVTFRTIHTRALPEILLADSAEDPRRRPAVPGLPRWECPLIPPMTRKRGSPDISVKAPVAARIGVGISHLTSHI